MASKYGGDYTQELLNNVTPGLSTHMATSWGENHYCEQPDIYENMHSYEGSVGPNANDYSQVAQSNITSAYDYSQLRDTGRKWNAEIIQEPASKRQKVLDLPSIQRGHGTRVNIHDADTETISSECCSSCSSGVLCDEPDCNELRVVAIPCDQQSCDELACPCPEPCLVKTIDGCVIRTSQMLPPQVRIENWRKNKSPWAMDEDAYAPQNAHLHGTADSRSVMSSAGSSKRNRTRALVPKRTSFIMADVSPTALATTKALEMESNISTTIGKLIPDMWDTAYPSKPANIEPVFNCDWGGCAQPFSTEDALGDHVHRTHVDPLLLLRCPAPKCTERMSPDPLQQHIQEDHGFQFTIGNTCPAPGCPQETVYDEDKIHSHFHVAHTDPDNQPLLCGWGDCGNEFLNQNQFWNHLPIHFNPDIPQFTEAAFAATFAPMNPTANVQVEEQPSNTAQVCCWAVDGAKCGKTFDDEELLQQHLYNNHVKDLKKTKHGYSCEWEGCNRREKKGDKAGFDQRSKIERHTYTHTGHKPSKCVICGARFSADQARDQHIRSAHTNERPFKCTYCDKSFPQHSACLMHIRTHTKDKPLSCDICGQKFGESSNLAKHRKIHGAQGGHACNFPGCGKTFVRANQLSKHRKEHQGFCEGSVSGRTSASGTVASDDPS